MAEPLITLVCVQCRDTGNPDPPVVGTVILGADGSRIWVPTAGRLPQPLDDEVTFVHEDGSETFHWMGESLLGICPVHDAMSVPAALVRDWIEAGVTVAGIFPAGWQTRPE